MYDLDPDLRIVLGLICAGEIGRAHGRMVDQFQESLNSSFSNRHCLLYEIYIAIAP